MTKKTNEYFTNERIRLQLEDMKRAGDIKEAALVVSYSGLELLTQTIMNSMERVVKEAVEKSNRELLEGLMEGFTRFALQQEIPKEKSSEEIVSERLVGDINAKAEEILREKFVKKDDKWVRNEEETPKPKAKRTPWNREDDETLVNTMDRLLGEGYAVEAASKITAKNYFDNRTWASCRERYKRIKQKQGV